MKRLLALVLAFALVLSFTPPAKAVQNGWSYEGGHWYYYENGNMVKDAWRKDSIGWCYLGEDGAMLTDTWLQDSVGWCYIGADGYCETNCWKMDSVGWIYLNSEGSMTKNAWVLDGGAWYYLDGSGYMVSNQWRKDSVGWCYLTGSGAMAVDCWVQDSVGWCYIGANGYAVTNCWKADSVGWCYLNSEGSMTKNAWVEDGGSWYYLDGNGYMVTGEYTVDGEVYIFGADGALQESVEEVPETKPEEQPEEAPEETPEEVPEEAPAPCTHTNTATETKEADCLNYGYVRTVCTACGEIISETTSPTTAHSYNTTMRMSEVAKYWLDKGELEFLNYVNHYDINVDVCGECNWPDFDSLRFAYSAEEATDIMLEYVNELRTSVYGTDAYNLVASPTLIELASLRAKQILTNYSHDGMYSGTSENIVASEHSIYAHFKAWEASPGHYANMIDDWHREFGYAAIFDCARNSLYGAMLFK